MPRFSSPRRVAVTGLGLVSPLGIGNRENWDALTAGRCGLGPITRFDASRFTSRIAGEVKGFDPSLYIDKKEIKKMDTFIHYAMGAAHLAMEDSGWPSRTQNRERFAVVVGSGIGGLPLIEDTQKKYVENGGNPRVISPFFITGLIVNEAGGNISIKYGMKGPNLATVTACTTGAHAIGEAFRMIQYGEADQAHRRRHGSGDHAARGGRLRRDEGALDAQRRSAARLAPLGPRPRRLRHRRGRRPRGPRGDGVGAEARRADLLRARRLRHVGRRVPHRRPVGGRRRARRGS